MSDGSERLHALDAVRGFALVLGVFFHATMAYLPGQTPMWMVLDSERSATLGVAFYVLHIFRMTTFFVIAGFFARMLFHRRGLAGFARDRGKRIGLPLVVGWPVVLASLVGATIAATFIHYGGPPPFAPPPAPKPKLFDFPLTHLWFLYVLIVFYALGLAGRAAIVGLDKAGRLGAALDRGLSMLVRGGVAPLVLALPLVAGLLALPQWRMWVGIQTPDSSLIINSAALLGFGTAFVFGWLLQRQAALLGAIEKAWPLNLALALAATAMALWQVGLTPTAGTNLPGVDRTLYAATYAFADWAWTFAFIGLAMRFLSGFSAWRRYLADASYWIYIVHLPLVILLQGLVATQSWPALVKYAVVLALAFPLMLGSYHLLVRFTWLGAILNGKRQPRPERRRIPSPSPREQEPAR